MVGGDLAEFLNDGGMVGGKAAKFAESQCGLQI